MIGPGVVVGVASFSLSAAEEANATIDCMIGPGVVCVGAVSFPLFAAEAAKALIAFMIGPGAAGDVVMGGLGVSVAAGMTLKPPFIPRPKSDALTHKRFPQP